MFNMFLMECADIIEKVTAIRMFNIFLYNCRPNRNYYKPDELHFNHVGLIC